MNNISFKETAIDDYKIISDLYNYYIANSTATYHIKSLSAEEVVEFFQLREDTTFSFIIYMDDNFSGFCLLKQYSKKGRIQVYF